MASAGIYEYTVKLRDKLSPAMMKAAKTTQAATTKMAKNFDGINKKVVSFGKNAAKLGAVAAGAGLVYMGKMAIESAVNIEKTRISFQTMLGDVQKGNKLFEQLTRFSNITPFENEEVQSAGRQLLTAGIAADKISEQLKMVGDVAAGANVPLNEMAAIYAKGLNKGKVQGEILDQLGERGVPVLATLAKMLGVTKEEIYDMGSKGKLTSKDLTKAFELMTGAGGMFQNMMGEQAKTIGGMWSTFMGTLKNELGNFALAYQDTIKNFLQTLINAVKWISQNREQLLSWISVGFKIISVIGAWIAVQTVLNAVLTANPIGIIITAISGLIVLITYAIYKFDEWGETLLAFMGPIGWIVGGFVKIYKAWNMIKEGFNKGGLLGAIKAIGRALVDFMLAPFEAIISAIAKFTDWEWADNLAAKTKEFRGKFAEDQAAADKRAASKKYQEEAAERQKKRLNNNGSWRPGMPKGTAAGAMAAGGVPIGTQKPKATTTGGIIAGGKKATNINISLEQLVETLNINSQTIDGGVKQVEEKVTTALLRVLNSANQYA